MARRKNVKRIDPRYFLNETVNRNEDGSALEEKFQGIPQGAATPELQLKAGPSRAEKEATAAKKGWPRGVENCEEFAEWLGKEAERLRGEDDQGREWGMPADYSGFEAYVTVAKEKCGITGSGYNYYVGSAPPPSDLERRVAAKHARMKQRHADRQAAKSPASEPKQSGWGTRSLEEE